MTRQIHFNAFDTNCVGHRYAFDNQLFARRMPKYDRKALALLIASAAEPAG
jgi:hypothetical protein